MHVFRVVYDHISLYLQPHLHPPSAGDATQINFIQAQTQDQSLKGMESILQWHNPFILEPSEPALILAEKGNGRHGLQVKKPSLAGMLFPFKFILKVIPSSKNYQFKADLDYLSELPDINRGRNRGPETSHLPQSSRSTISRPRLNDESCNERKPMSM